MAVLGFILGLGFLIPISTDSPRDPASSTSESIVFTDPQLEPTDAGTEEFAEPDATFDIETPTPSRDQRANILFDIHTIATSRFAKGTDAWVQTGFYDKTRRDEITKFTYCHNYDFDAQRADTTLDRYAVSPSPKRFKCFLITLDDLVRGVALIRTPLGDVLTLRSRDFDPKRGGTLSLIFAYRVGVFKNDYRTLDLKIRLERGTVRAFGPRGESFAWVNLKMSEALGIPNGLNGFELFQADRSVGKYPGKNFPKTTD